MRSLNISFSYFSPASKLEFLLVWNFTFSWVPSVFMDRSFRALIDWPPISYDGTGNLFIGSKACILYPECIV